MKAGGEGPLFLFGERYSHKNKENERGVGEYIF